jgi:hypothetical protein
MTASSKGPTYWLFWLVLALWLATAFPIALWSLLTFELPLWPSFSEESTTEGIMIWATFAAWFYITPVALIMVNRRARMSASEQNPL